MSGEILFLAHRLPFPPDRGDKIRSHHVLKALARLAPVHVGCFAESAADYAHEGLLASIAASHCLPLRRKHNLRAGVEAIVSGGPVSCAAFRHAKLAAWVRHTLETRDIAAIYVFSGQMGQYVPAGWETAGQRRLVVDLVDVDSAKFEAYASEGTGPMAWVNTREGRLLRAMEAALVQRAHRTLLVSEAEANLLRSRVATSAGQRIAALPNGIDAAGFDPRQSAPHADLHGNSGPQIVFTGQMDYPPNIAAARRMANNVLPLIRDRHPQAMFHIVGRAPVREVVALDALPGCRVWGEVPDVRPFLLGADVVVAPLAIARGVQNKALEAMAMARPVLLTPQAATGIAALDGVHFAVAESDTDLAARALALIAAPEQAAAMGAAARELVLQNMSWPAAMRSLPQIMGLPNADEHGAVMGNTLHAA